MKKFIFYFIAAFYAFLSACEKGNDGDEALDKSGAFIYYQWTEENTKGKAQSDIPWLIEMCDAELRPVFTNPAIPNGSIKGKYYGPVEAGSFSITMSGLSNQTTIPLVLEKPAPGYSRYYTHKLRGYNSRVYRCLIESGLTFEDRPN